MSEEEVKTPEEEKVAAAATPKDATPKDAAPRDATPKDAAPKDAAPKDAAPKDATPKDAAPKDAATPEESAAEPEKKEVTAEDLLKSDLDGVKIRRAKGSKNITSGVVNVLATFNNTKVTFTDPGGNVISWSSAGKCNFRGSRKSTAYAAQVVTQDAGRVAMSHGMKEVVVKLKGPGMGRDSAVRALQSLGMIVTEIVDVTPVPHNGCRSPKRRRV
jgi:small subunit ribosomal protein S11